MSNDKQRQFFKEDLTVLSNWASAWEMLLNIDKCKVIHIGNSNLEAKYEMSGKKLEQIKQEKDLEVIVLIISK